MTGTTCHRLVILCLPQQLVLLEPLAVNFVESLSVLLLGIMAKHWHKAGRFLLVTRERNRDILTT